MTKPVTKLGDPSKDTTHGVNVAQAATHAAAIAITDRVPGFGCGKCSGRWGGTRTAHCGGCCRTFSSLGSFDKHRTGSHAYGTRHCLDPATAGLALQGRKYECWGYEGDGTNFWNEDS